jgi:sugar/nucleoside kinase (ribokinase family)
MGTDGSGTNRSGVIAGGNWIIDHVKVLDAWPAQDALATILSQSDGNGGGPYNLLKDLARLRAPFPLAGVALLGTDANGDQILADCDAHGIDRSGCHRIDAAPTSFTDVMTVVDTGRRTFFHCHGANALLGRDHFPLSSSSAKVFYLGYLCLLQRLDAVRPDGGTEAADLLGEARKLGMITMADLVSTPREDFQAIVAPSLPHLDYLFLNEFELARLTDRAAVDAGLDAMKSATQSVLAMGVHRAVLVHQPGFALWMGRDGVEAIQPAVRVPQELIRGTVGAGDAFAAGVLFGIHEGWSPDHCLELGVCTAACSLQDTTSSASVRPWEECLAFGRDLGFNAVPAA